MSGPRGREALLQAAIRTVGEKGMSGLTYRGVAEKAGVSHGLIRHHFGTKQQLVEEALQYAIEQSLAQTGMFSGSTEVGSFAQGIGSGSGETDYLHAFQYEVLLASRRNPELRPLVKRYYDIYRNATYSRLSELGVNDPVLSQAIWFVLDAIVLKEITLGADEETEQVLTFIRDTVVRNAK